MLCAYKPDVLASTMKALDSLGLDVHRANISCFNGFSLDVFKAEVYICFSPLYFIKFLIQLPCHLFYNFH
ncbi:hypothetical protein MtrunA17_Chr2g0318461 [Medicago truncatula]|uniref:Plant bHLH transcription factor ACT-like domain-containing protein n=1 Tax=Medicago truncatula TaxID=3880 RepID=A0A396JAJ9_MEDTR|nr:hypothetical protein MtrunA17_Chr2g0318461 [Medicago truncatula]